MALSAAEGNTEKPAGRDTARSHVNWLCRTDGRTERRPIIQQNTPRLTRNPGAQEVKKFPVLGVHDGPLDELHHRLAPVLKLGVAPQAEGPFRENRNRFVLR